MSRFWENFSRWACHTCGAEMGAFREIPPSFCCYCGCKFTGYMRTEIEAEESTHEQ